MSLINKKLNEYPIVFPENVEIEDSKIIWEGKEFNNVINFRKSFERSGGEYKYNSTCKKYFPIGYHYVKSNVKYLKNNHLDIYQNLKGDDDEITKLYIYFDKISTSPRTCVYGFEEISFESQDEQNKYFNFNPTSIDFPRMKDCIFDNKCTKKGCIFNHGGRKDCRYERLPHSRCNNKFCIFNHYKREETDFKFYDSKFKKKPFEKNEYSKPKKKSSYVEDDESEEIEKVKLKKKSSEDDEDYESEKMEKVKPKKKSSEAEEMENSKPKKKSSEDAEEIEKVKPKKKSPKEAEEEEEEEEEIDVKPKKKLFNNLKNDKFKVFNNLKNDKFKL